MGLFSFFCKKIDEGLTSLGEKATWIGDKIADAGDFIGNEVLENAGHWISEKGNELADWAGSSDAYDEDFASVSDIVDLSEHLSAFSHQIADESDKLENKAKAEIEQYYYKLIEHFEKVGFDKYSKRLQTVLKTINRNINGIVKNYVAKRVSLDDEKCVEILSKPAGKGKKAAMTRFKNTVINEALEKLEKEMKSLIALQNQEIADIMRSELAAEEEKCRQQEEKFKQILDNQAKELDNQKNLLLVPKMLVETSDLLIEKLVVE